MLHQPQKCHISCGNIYDSNSGRNPNKLSTVSLSKTFSFDCKLHSAFVSTFELLPLSREICCNLRGQRFH